MYDSITMEPCPSKYQTYMGTGTNTHHWHLSGVGPCANQENMSQKTMSRSWIWIIRINMHNCVTVSDEISFICTVLYSTVYWIAKKISKLPVINEHGKLNSNNSNLHWKELLFISLKSEFESTGLYCIVYH